MHSAKKPCHIKKALLVSMVEKENGKFCLNLKKKTVQKLEFKLSFKNSMNLKWLVKLKMECLSVPTKIRVSMSMERREGKGQELKNHIKQKLSPLDVMM